MSSSPSRRSRAPLNAINITPLVDVLLILVAALLLLAPHLVKSLPVQLPRTALNAHPVAQRSLQIGIDASGSLFMSGHSTSLTEIRAHIIPGITSLQIAADRRTSYGQLAKLVDELRDTRPREIILLTE